MQICCNISGENFALAQSCNREGLGIKFEFTAPNTPQQNRRAECKFATLFGRVRAMLNGAGLSNAL
jgi:hypothetical protein